MPFSLHGLSDIYNFSSLKPKLNAYNSIYLWWYINTKMFEALRIFYMYDVLPFYKCRVLSRLNNTTNNFLSTFTLRHC